MLTINKLHCDSAIDHAALELRKYLRMMMPEAGDIKIAYAPEAKDGFRLGFWRISVWHSPVRTRYRMTSFTSKPM